MDIKGAERAGTKTQSPKYGVGCRLRWFSCVVLGPHLPRVRATQISSWDSSFLRIVVEVKPSGSLIQINLSAIKVINLETQDISALSSTLNDIGFSHETRATRYEFPPKLNTTRNTANTIQIRSYEFWCNITMQHRMQS